MRSIAITRSGVLVTGSSGFIGQHLCGELQRRQGGAPLRAVSVDIADRAALDALASRTGTAAVIHLAAYGRVVAPTSVCAEMFATSVHGTLNVLRSLQPRVIVFASSCAVYGETPSTGVRPEFAPPSPVGLYGLAKHAAEMLIAQWAAETTNSGVVLRIGNVIGAGCGGLIPYLVRHAIAHPDGNVPAQLRGGGCVVRDYVPVAHAVRIMAAAAEREWLRGEFRTFNVSTGRGTANRRVAEIVGGLMAAHGYRLRVEYSDSTARGEAWQAILDPRSTTDEFGIEAPDADCVLDAIETAAMTQLRALAPAGSPAEQSK